MDKIHILIYGAQSVSLSVSQTMQFSDQLLSTGFRIYLYNTKDDKKNYLCDILYSFLFSNSSPTSPIVY